MLDGSMCAGVCAGPIGTGSAMKEKPRRAPGAFAHSVTNGPVP